ncbi:MAG: transglutaminase domain-containing protein [Fimbriimonadaceae bacterium]|nr:transglutaminase domain-containing protein [Fimbriimonadaceae bacterium]
MQRWHVGRVGLRAVLVGSLVLLSGCREGSVATAAPLGPVESWFSAYLQGQKIGYMSETIAPTTVEGEALIQYTSRNYAALQVLGQRMEQVTVWVSLCDAQYRPRTLEFTLKSGERSTAVTATFGPDRITGTRTSGAQSTPIDVPIPPGTELVVDAQPLLSAKRLKIGDELTVMQFNPVTLKIEQCTVKALRQEPLPLAGATLEATVVEMSSPMVKAELWVDAEGRLLQLASTAMAAKLEYKREDKDAALAGVDAAGTRIDLAVATAIRPATPIADPGNTARLKLRVKGLEKLAKVPSDAFQQVGPAGPDGWREVVLDTAKIPRPRPLSLPLTAAKVGGAARWHDLQPYLAAGAYLEADHPKMQAAGAAAVKGAKDLASAIDQVRASVHDRIHWQSNIGLFRSALEVLEDPAGVCRDAAALYVAMARAAGLPSRVCGGLVYVGGAFMGHAWAESWAGDWIPVDATRSTAFVDATHLKLAQGDEYAVVFEMLPALGGVQIEVVEAQPRPAPVP